MFSCAQILSSVGRERSDILSTDTANSKPVKLPPRRLPMAQREIVDRELEKMLKEDIIEPSDSPWAALKCCLGQKERWFC